MTYRRVRQGGFTLLELIVALAVSALLAVAGAAALSTVIDVYHRSSQRVEARENTRAIERVLRHEWSGRGRVVKSDGHMLDFITAPALTDPLTENFSLAQVRYSCEFAAPDDLVLKRSARTIIPGAIGTNGELDAVELAKEVQVQMLASHLKSCSFSFLVQQRTEDGKRIPKWVSKWTQDAAAPTLMRLAISGVRSDLPPVVYQANTGGAP